jgi:hypothetical protein
MLTVTKQGRKRRLKLSIDSRQQVRGTHNYATMSKLISTLRRLSASVFEKQNYQP